MKTKTFTVKEANRLIPKIKNTFDEIFISRKKIAIMSNELSWIHEFWGAALRDSDNPDSERHDMLVEMVKKEHINIQKNIDQLQKRGCIIKDLNTGLVDLYTVIDSELAFLCWQYGEKSIQYWHPIDEDRGRRPFDKIDKME